MPSSKRLRLTIVVLVASLTGGAARARDWFVAPPPLGSDTQAGTLAQPFATIQRGATAAQAGDTVRILPGTYRPTSTIRPANSGTEDAPITYRAEPGGEVIVDGQFAVPGYSWDGLIWIDRKRWIVIEGLTVVNSAWFGISANGSTGITVRGCTTDNTYASGIYIASSDRVKVLNNTVRRACVHPLTTPLKDTQECITLASVANFEVAYNTVSDRTLDHSNGGEGIDAKGSCRDGSIHHNHVYNLVRLGVYLDSFAGLLENVDVYSNHVHHCPSGIVVACESGGTARNIRIRDNLVRDCARLGIRLASYLGNGPIQNVLIAHNTVIRCGFAPFGVEDTGIYLESNNVATRDIVVRNNIVAHNKNQIRRRTPESAVTIENNLVFGPSLITGLNAITSAPGFVQALANNFRLAPGSPAIDAASGADSPLDHEDRSRPLAGDAGRPALADLGAFEFDPTPTFVRQPIARTVLPGSAFMIEAVIEGRVASYQWLRDGVPLPGETSDTLHRSLAGPADAGSYTLEAVGPTGTRRSLPADISIAADASRLLNVSCRTVVAPGGVAIPGFVLVGSGRRTVLVRAVGPGLIPFGVKSVMPDPTLRVFHGNSPIAFNDNWDPAGIGDSAVRTGAFALAPGSLDAALVVTLDAPGAYTVHASDRSPTGNGSLLVEVYDVNAAADTSGVRLGNVSIRTRAGRGDGAIILGFVLDGAGRRQLLLRGIGPELLAYGVPAALVDPAITLFNVLGRAISSNDDWGQYPFPAQIDRVRQAIGAFPLKPGSADAATVVDLASGTYTLHVGSADVSEGEALAEVYESP